MKGGGREVKELCVSSLRVRVRGRERGSEEIGRRESKKQKISERESTWKGSGAMWKRVRWT